MGDLSSWRSSIRDKLPFGLLMIFIFSKVKKPLFLTFSIITGESIGIGVLRFSKERNGSNLKIRVVDRFFVNTTLKAPFCPSEGEIVPER